MQLESWRRLVPSHTWIEIVGLHDRRVVCCMVVLSHSSMVMNMPVRVGEDSTVLGAIRGQAAMVIVRKGRVVITIMRMPDDAVVRPKWRDRSGYWNVMVQAAASAVDGQCHALDAYAHHQHNQPETRQQPHRPEHQIRLRVAKAVQQEHAAKGKQELRTAT